MARIIARGKTGIMARVIARGMVRRMAGIMVRRMARRMTRGMIGSSQILGFVIGFFLGQLVSFGYLTLTKYGNSAQTLTQYNGDSAVVLTGSRGRLNKGIELLSQGNIKRLFVIGVGGKAYLDELLAPYPEFDFSKKGITISHWSVSTSQNAIQISQWVRQKAITDEALIITETLHMPRAISMIKHCSPKLRVMPYAVWVNGWFRNVKMLIREYLKTIYYLIFPSKCSIS